MGISPTSVGELHPTWTFTWTDDVKPVGNAINLTGATMSGRIAPSNAHSQGRGLAGSFQITSAVAGQFNYRPASGDLALPGDYVVQFVATFGDGPLFSPLVTLHVDQPL